MRKNDLIKLLQGLKGNPEIGVWNGYVEDFMVVGELIETNLVKKTFDFYQKGVTLQEKCKTGDLSYVMSDQGIQDLKGMYNTYIDWEMNEYVGQEDVDEKRYSKKRMVLIQPKVRGKSTFDRSGRISY